MNTDTRLRIFGTDEALPVSRRLSAGALSVEITAGAVRGLFWHGVEVLRAVDYPIRNADWGTYPAVTTSEDFNEDESGFTYSREFSVGDDLLAGTFTCSGASAGKLTVSLELTANREVRVSRAGFVLLHPVAGVAGSPLRVTHSDGSIEETTFPERISPSQPVFDIAALRQSANGVIADVAFTGDTFEMEDQRNWSDASYKTYCRPLSLPYPYDVAAVADNPLGVRCPMAKADPRQRGLFTAAWMIGAVAATGASAVERMALAAPAGPLGLMDGNRAHPAFHAFAALTQISSRDRLAITTPAGIAAVAASSPHGSALIVANLGIEPREITLPQSAQSVTLDTLQPDPGWLTDAPRQRGSTLTLGPYAVAFASIGPHDFFGPSA